MRSAKQVIANHFGGPDVLQIIDVPVPPPGPGQLLVRVEAAGVLYGDIMRRTDRYLTPTPLPYEPGTEIAGTVAEIGKQVSAWNLGDRLVCRLPAKGYAQYALVNAEQAIHLPDTIGFGEATGLLAQGITAYLLTHEMTTLKSRSVFIESAAGGVGMQMVQMARKLGATYIVGSASTEEKRAFILANGVDLAVDSSARGWSEQIFAATDGGGIEVAFESSGASICELLKCLSAFGTLVKFGRGVDEDRALHPSLLVEKNQTLRGFYLPGYFEPVHAPLIAAGTRALIEAVLSGELKVRIDHRYPLDEVVLAHQAIEERKTIGKLVLEPWSV